MVKPVKKLDPKRIEELRKKIRDKEYLSAAIQRIANTLSKEILGGKGE